MLWSCISSWFFGSSPGSGSSRCSVYFMADSCSPSQRISMRCSAGNSNQLSYENEDVSFTILVKFIGQAFVDQKSKGQVQQPVGQRNNHWQCPGHRCGQWHWHSGISQIIGATWSSSLIMCQATSDMTLIGAHNRQYFRGIATEKHVLPIRLLVIGRRSLIRDNLWRYPFLKLIDVAGQRL